MNNPKTEEIVEALRECKYCDDEICIACPASAPGFPGCGRELMLIAANRIEELEAELAELKEQQRWIPVTERMPEDDDSVRFHKCFSTIFTSVLAYEKECGVSVVNRLMIGHSSIKSLDELATDGYVWSNGCNPTHWAPLPVPPKK